MLERQPSDKLCLKSIERGLHCFKNNFWQAVRTKRAVNIEAVGNKLDNGIIEMKRECVLVMEGSSLLQKE